MLRAAAEEVGLNADDMQRDVEAGRYTAAVKEQVEEAYALGINGLPTYILNDKYALVGAQPFEVFKQALERLAAVADDGSK